MREFSNWYFSHGWLLLTVIGFIAGWLAGHTNHPLRNVLAIVLCMGILGSIAIIGRT